MNYRDAQDLAVKFGAKPFSRGPNCHTVGCWIDRIEYLPNIVEHIECGLVTEEEGKAKLAEWIDEANRYA
jgi:hypothetical protein